MKVQPVEAERDTVDYSVGQRPIHGAYEPPNRIPQFRPRPKVHQTQPSKRRPQYATITKEATQSTSTEATANSLSADAKKSN